MLYQFYFQLTEISSEKNLYFGMPLFCLFCKKKELTTHARLCAQYFVTDKNFSFNQGHKKEFQSAFVLGKVNL